jgi:hypothetical protein
MRNPFIACLLAVGAIALAACETTGTSVRDTSGRTIDSGAREWRPAATFAGNPHLGGPVELAEYVTLQDGRRNARLVLDNSELPAADLERLGLSDGRHLVFTEIVSRFRSIPIVDAFESVADSGNPIVGSVMGPYDRTRLSTHVTRYWPAAATYAWTRDGKPCVSTLAYDGSNGHLVRAGKQSVRVRLCSTREDVDPEELRAFAVGLLDSIQPQAIAMAAR